MSTVIPESDEVLRALARRIVLLYVEWLEAEDVDSEAGDRFKDAIEALTESRISRLERLCLHWGEFIVSPLREFDGEPAHPYVRVILDIDRDADFAGVMVEAFLTSMLHRQYDEAVDAFEYLVGNDDDEDLTLTTNFLTLLAVLASEGVGAPEYDLEEFDSES